ncbi:DUF883 C-terminal domain-containing protein [Methylobacter sp.]|uniref:DUF883 C-terminal domain-containing protein n=1 Tax=Methylobacter sp. TaxID=2051955 RepID=UPI002FDC7DCD
METIDIASDLAHGTIDKIADAAKKVFGSDGEQLDDAEQQMINDFRNYIHDNPIMSMGIAVTAGFILSRFLVNR